MMATVITTAARVLTGAQARGYPPQAGPHIYFVNHTSNMDFVIVWTILPPELRRMTRPVAAHDYWNANPIRRYLARDVFHAVLIERKHVTRENNPLPIMLKTLDEGSSIIIFPEGGRSTSDTLLPFKSGIYHIASARPEIDLVPVFIENLNRVLPKGEILPIPMLCSVSFGEPIRLQAGEARNDFLARAKGAIERLRDA